MKTNIFALFLVFALIQVMIFNLAQTKAKKGRTGKNKVTSQGFSSNSIGTFKRSIGDTEELLLNTTGCVIPDFAKNLWFSDAKYLKKYCKKRLVFVDKVGDNKIMFRMREQKKKSLKCCYQFASRHTNPNKVEYEVGYSGCKSFAHGDVITLQEEAIVVSCAQTRRKKRVLMYKDAYLTLKKVKRPEVKDEKSPPHWNVLTIGLDTMSRARTHYTLPKTVKFLLEDGWLDYRGFNKVGSSSYPNIMAMLTGNQSSLDTCYYNMTKCHDSFIWRHFKEAGYVTAYGGDTRTSCDINWPYHMGYKTPPTDHYTKHFFLIGHERRGNINCVHSRPGAHHILDYMVEFVEQYKHDRFFGFFWLESYSHDGHMIPGLLDDKLTSVFQSIKDSGALYNTFIFFLGDHGIRFGGIRLLLDSYYQDRLPMFFAWTPLLFRILQKEKSENLKLNQHRLTTPYDFHATLSDILKMSGVSKSSQVCRPNCTSLFEEISPNRTCSDTGMEPEFCACHNMLDAANDTEAQRSVELVLTSLNTKTQSVKFSEKCARCKKMNLMSVLRTNSYKMNGKTYFVVAILLDQDEAAFEAVTEWNNGTLTVASQIDRITSYEPTAYCVSQKADKPYCLCDKVIKCK